MKDKATDLQIKATGSFQEQIQTGLYFSSFNILELYNSIISITANKF